MILCKRYFKYIIFHNESNVDVGCPIIKLFSILSGAEQVASSGTDLLHARAVGGTLPCPD